MGKSSKSSTKSVKDEITAARAVVGSLIRKGVKLVALDFDKTIVSVHTAGFWRQGTPKLAEHVRPCFKALIKAALESPLHLCVVTYSMQPQLIQDVLKLVLPNSNVNEIIIRASSKEWLPPGNPNSQILGKQQHIAWMVTQLFHKHHLIIHPHEIFLIDDDEENVDMAKKFGHLAYTVPEEVTIENIREFVDRMDLVRVSRSRSFVAMKKSVSDMGRRDHARSYGGEGVGRDSRMVMQSASNSSRHSDGGMRQKSHSAEFREASRERSMPRDHCTCQCEDKGAMKRNGSADRMASTAMANGRRSSGRKENSKHKH